MELRQPGTRTHLPEIESESDGRNTDTTQDHYETRVDRDEQRWVGEEVQMEPVNPVPNLPKDVVIHEYPFFRRSTRVTRPSTKYPTAEFDLT